jgi:hypothetical protein
MGTMADMHMMLGEDGKVVQVDLGPMLARHRARHVRLRADAVCEVADLAHSRAFDLDEVGAAGTERFGADVVDAAFDVVYELMQIEEPRQYE